MLGKKISNSVEIDLAMAGQQPNEVHNLSFSSLVRKSSSKRLDETGRHKSVKSSSQKVSTAETESQYCKPSSRSLLNKFKHSSKALAPIEEEEKKAESPEFEIEQKYEPELSCVKECTHK